MRVDADLALARRAEFPILSTCTYLISNSLGAMPARTPERLAQYARTWREQGQLAWDEWLAAARRAGDLIGALIGAGAGEVTILQNVSSCEWVLASCLDYAKGRDKIVYSDLEFPTIHYLWQAQARRGARVEVVKSRDGLRADVEALCDAIDERTVAVPISHVLFRTSAVCDVAPIVEKAHRVGAYVFLDVFQSVGVFPIDARALGVDAVVGGCLKWLCGGPGAAFLWVRPDLYERLSPAMIGWFGHKRPFDFDMGAFEPADDVSRYSGGTSNMPAIYAALGGLEIINEVGVAHIRARNVELTELLIERAQQAGITVRSPLDAKQRGGHVTLDVPDARRACDELIRRKFMVDFRPNAGIRVAPHFYNTRDEVAAVVRELVSIRDGR
ncbi:MAG: aminotransferase class V-fold PLP-dependent enzyme [Candidatus Eremiobacteraeota bacterium]|nr:aminotransferase class V-fold PLP-dependent enzyme [Candidatus Eremiobacteraeota bacterium]